MKKRFKRVQFLFIWLLSISLLAACRTHDIQENTADKDIIEQETREKNDEKVIKENSKKSNEVSDNSTLNSFEEKIDEEAMEGKNSYRLDDYIGEDYEEVRAELAELGFDVNKEEEQSKSIAAGDIIQQRPQPGETATPDEDTIVFLVSTGMPVISLRDLTYYPKEGVQDYVESKGLKLTTEEVASDNVPLDLVVSQEPQPGTSLQEGDRITVIFSTGPEN